MITWKTSITSNTYRTMKNIILLLCILCGLLIIPGVAQAQKKTTPFQEVKEIPTNKAVVYIFRVGYYGRAVHYTVNANGVPVSPVQLYTGGYLVCYADPGKTEFWAKVADGESRITVDIEAGKSYFIQGSVKMGVWVGRPFLQDVDANVGLKNIKKCKLLALDSKGKD